MPRFLRVGCFKSFLAAASILVLMETGCATKKPHPPSQEEGSSFEGAPSESLTPVSVFPHREGWKEPASHGVVVQKTGRESC